MHAVPAGTREAQRLPTPFVFEHSSLTRTTKVWQVTPYENINRSRNKGHFLQQNHPWTLRWLAVSSLLRTKYSAAAMHFRCVHHVGPWQRDMSMQLQRPHITRAPSSISSCQNAFCNDERKVTAQLLLCSTLFRCYAVYLIKPTCFSFYV